MIKFKCHLFFLLNVFIFFQGAIAQSDKIDKADSKFENFAYLDAREIYLEVASEGYRSAELLKKLGDSYYFTNDYRNALFWYSELIENYKEKDYESDYFFRYSVALKSLGFFSKSEKFLKKYYKENGLNYDDIIDSEKRYLEDNLNGNSKNIEVYNYKLNSKYSDYAPRYLSNGRLIFSSARDSVHSKIHNWNNEPFTDLYIVEDGEPSKIEGKVNTRFNEATAAFSQEEDTLYFTRNNYNKKKGKNTEGTMLLKLYRATSKNGGYLNNIEELEFNNDEFSIAHPALSPDGKKLYFASDMPGGYGASDLYEVPILKDGKFGEVKNLGSRINTGGRETFPYIDDDGNLYFSSDGHYGLGGLDLFFSESLYEGFDLPYNMGKPINSMYDDFSLIYSPRKKEGFFASNRPKGWGSDDLYFFKNMGKESRLYIKCQKVISGVISESNDNYKVLKNAKVIVYDVNNNKLLETKVDNNGRYKFALKCDRNFIVRYEESGYQGKEIIMSTKGDKQIINKSIKLIRGNSTLEKKWISVGSDLTNSLSLENIYFDLNKSAIKKVSTIELQKIIWFLKKYPKAKLKINSYTDITGSIKYNKKLSEDRANNAKAYILKKGKIDPNRISTEGFGESRPLIDCYPNCTESDNAKNRRAEFIISK